MKTSPSKKSNPKTKGSVLNASLVFKNPLSNKSLNTNPQKKKKKKKIKKKKKKF
ncbi:hypothetical protein ID0436_08370 [Helicobacter pylori]